ncbi:hypothetical protein HDU83_000855 [Entophlyctis luteolus]|nr:hypothetical protein HDU83_000855 [Entophlyctis luteolus]
MNQLLSELDELMRSLSTDNSSCGDGNDGGDNDGGVSTLALPKASDSDGKVPSATEMEGDDWVLGFYSTSSTGSTLERHPNGKTTGIQASTAPSSDPQMTELTASGILRQKTVRGRSQTHIPQITLAQLKQSQITMSAYLHKFDDAKLNEDEPDSRSKWQQGYFVLGEGAHLFEYNDDSSPIGLPVFHVLITSCYAFLDVSGSYLLRITSDEEKQSCVLRFPDEKTTNKWMRAISQMRLSQGNATPPAPSSSQTFVSRPLTVETDVGVRYFVPAQQYMPPGRGSSQTRSAAGAFPRYTPKTAAGIFDQVLQSPTASNYTMGIGVGTMRNFPPDGIPVFLDNSGHSQLPDGVSGGKNQPPQFPSYFPPLMAQRVPSVTSSGYRKVMTADGSTATKDLERNMHGEKSKMLELAEIDRRYKQTALERMKAAKENAEAQADAAKLRTALGM